jgi:hypothetical protein
MYTKSKRKVEMEQRIQQWPQTLDWTDASPELSRAKTAKYALALQGRVVFPWDKDYHEARQESNPAFQKFPLIIVYCETFNDVRISMLFAEEFDIWIVSRSGGHSTAGYSVNTGGIVIDVSNIKYVHVNTADKTAQVGAGTNFGYLNAQLNEFRLHVPSGSCEDVCVGGFMQGGGYGYTSRRYGMNCDNVISFRMMLRGGRIVTASANQNKHLYWAVRGGTGNNFGILLDVNYQLHELWKVWGFALEWDLRTSADVLIELQKNYMRSGVTDKLGYMGNIVLHEGKYLLVIQGIYAGDREGGMEALEGLMAIGDPEMSVDITLPYSEMIPYLDDHPFAMPDPPPGVKQAKQAEYIAKTMSKDDWQRIIDFYIGSDHPHYCIAVIEPYGGAISAVSTEAMAFNHRDVDMDFFVDSFWLQDDDKEVAFNWLNEFIDVLQPFVTGRVYQNYPCFYYTEYRWMYWSHAFPRLLATKDLYDPPPCVFHYPQSIKPYGAGEEDNARDSTDMAAQFDLAALGDTTIIYDDHPDDE